MTRILPQQRQRKKSHRRGPPGKMGIDVSVVGRTRGQATATIIIVHAAVRVARGTESANIGTPTLLLSTCIQNILQKAHAREDAHAVPGAQGAVGGAPIHPQAQSPGDQCEEVS